MELYQILSPMVLQAQELTASLDKHTQFASAWGEFLRSGACSLQERELGLKEQQVQMQPGDPED